VPDKSERQQNNNQNMHGTFSNEAVLLSQQMSQQLPLENNDDEIDLAVLWRAIWAGKYVIIAISFVFSVASISFALSKPNVYKASVLLSPASSEGSGGLGAIGSQLGGLASLAGVSLGGGGTDKTTLAIEILKSRAFLERYINKHELLVPLMAAKKWDSVENILIFDDEIYDQNTGEWLIANNAVPSDWEAYQKLLKLVTTTQDKITSLVTINIEFYSPEIAKQWLIWLVADVNNFMREKDEKEASASINYLTNQLEKTEVSAMEAVFYQLIEEQTKNMMLTKVSAEYVLKTVDPAQVPEKKSGPKRAIIVVLGTVFGGVLSVLVVLIRYFTNSNKSTKTKEDILA